MSCLGLLPGVLMRRHVYMAFGASCMSEGALLGGEGWDALYLCCSNCVGPCLEEECVFACVFKQITERV